MSKQHQAIKEALQGFETLEQSLIRFEDMYVRAQAMEDSVGMERAIKASDQNQAAFETQARYLAKVMGISVEEAQDLSHEYIDGHKSMKEILESISI